MKNKKLSLSKIFSKPRYIMLLSGFLGVVLWFYAATTLGPDINRVIDDIPVEVRMEGTVAETNGMQVIRGAEQKVNIEITGKRYRIGNLSADDFDIYTSTNEVSAAGEYSLAVKVKYKGTEEDVVIKSITPSTLTYKFDKYISNKVFPLEAEASSIKIADGYIKKGAVYPSTPTIEISGPEKDVQKISRCVLSTNNNSTLSNSEKLKGFLILYDIENNRLNLDTLNYDIDPYTVNVTVLKKITLPFEFGYTKVSANFDASVLPFQMSEEDIEIGINPEAEDTAGSSIFLGNIDFSKIKKGYSVTLPVTLPDSYFNINAIEEVDVTFDLNNLVSKTFTVDEINMIYRPSNYEISLNATRLYNVTVWGTPEILEELTSGDLTAHIDLSKESLTEGRMTVPVNISVNVPGMVWAVEDKTVSITVKKIE